MTKEKEQEKKKKKYRNPCLLLHINIEPTSTPVGRGWRGGEGGARPSTFASFHLVVVGQRLLPENQVIRRVTRLLLSENGSSLPWVFTIADLYSFGVGFIYLKKKKKKRTANTKKRNEKSLIRVIHSTWYTSSLLLPLILLILLWQSFYIPAPILPPPPRPKKHTKYSSIFLCNIIASQSALAYIQQQQALRLAWSKVSASAY